MGSSNPWPPYKECSLGICSIYCPQFCYVIFPPPPPSNSDDSSSSSTFFSPLVIAVMGILASAFLLVTYYLVVTRYCGYRRRRDGVIVAESSRAGVGGLEERVIKAISVYKYKKGEGLVEGTDCSVCLTEFEDNDSLRLMPKCAHAFHLPCIDMWLNSHSSCPLCRSSLLEFLPPPPPPPTVSVAHATHHPDSLLIICDSSGSGTIVRHEEAVVATSPKDAAANKDPRMSRSASAAVMYYSPTGGSSTSCEPVGQDLQISMPVETTHPVIKTSISTDRFMSGPRCQRKLIYPV